jgi:hypothetical protein
VQKCVRLAPFGSKFSSISTKVAAAAAVFLHFVSNALDENFRAKMQQNHHVIFLKIIFILAKLYFSLVFLES